MRMSEEAPDLERLERLIRLVETRHLTELIVEEGGVRYVVRGTGDPGDAPPPAATITDADGAREARLAVQSPMVGVFFAAPSPGDEPFVRVGDSIEAGQTIGLIEAMKVFSEIPSEYAGIVDEVAVSDGELVRPGQPLLYLRHETEGEDELIGDD